MDAKDLSRLEDIKTKANGSRGKAIALATTMANLITHLDKIEGRIEASKRVFGSGHPVTEVFETRRLELRSPWKRTVISRVFPKEEPILIATSEEILVENGITYILRDGATCTQCVFNRTGCTVDQRCKNLSTPSFTGLYWKLQEGSVISKPVSVKEPVIVIPQLYPLKDIFITHDGVTCKLTYEKDAKCANCYFQKYTLTCMSMTNNYCDKYQNHIWILN